MKYKIVKECYRFRTGKINRIRLRQIKILAFFREQTTKIY